MISYKGEYGSCEVMTDVIDANSVSTIYGFLNSPAAEGSKVRIMPDVHDGAGCVIGFTASVTSRVVPNLIGVDIGCGVGTWRFSSDFLQRKAAFLSLDTFIRKNVPSGAGSINDSPKLSLAPNKLLESLDEVCKVTNQNEFKVARAIGSLGGGNHFIELGRKEGSSDFFLTIHSGSRNFGLQVATFHQKLAKGRVGNRHGLEWLEGEDLRNYMKHMEVAQKYAELNRRTMASTILEFFGLKEEDAEKIESVHNYIDLEDGIIRKGAISAQKGKEVVIPWNMKDGLVIGVGKGNEEWNFSAPHGAGRSMRRGDAKRRLDLDAFKKAMDDAGVWTSCVSRGTLDESHFAYKDPKTIEEGLADTVDVLYTVKPIYNFKAE